MLKFIPISSVQPQQMCWLRSDMINLSRQYQYYLVGDKTADGRRLLNENLQNGIMWILSDLFDDVNLRFGLIDY